MLSKSFIKGPSHVRSHASLSCRSPHVLAALSLYRSPSSALPRPVYLSSGTETFHNQKHGLPRFAGSGLEHNDFIGAAKRTRSTAIRSCFFIGGSPRMSSSASDSSEGFEYLFKTGSKALARNDLGEAIAWLSRAIATEEGRFSSLALATLCNALIWAGRREESDTIAEEAVGRGVWESEMQRPLTFTSGLPTAPFPDALELGYSEVQEAMHAIEKSVRSDLRAIQDDVNICLEATEAPEGLQDPTQGAWKYTKINFSGVAWSFAGPWGDAQFPAISKILSKVQQGGQIQIQSAGISTIYPGTCIRPHCGPTNKCWDIHVGLSVPEPHASHLLVANHTRQWHEGEALLFDDSFEHQVTHNGLLPRTILDIVITHPQVRRDENPSGVPRDYKK